MIHELEKEVKPGKDEGGKEPEQENAPPAQVISYPKVGVAYDPKQTNHWSNRRGFQNPALASSWLGLSVAPGAVPTKLPEPTKAAGDEKYDPAEHSADDEDRDGSPEKTSLFQDIFGEERPPSPEHNDDIPSQAFCRYRFIGNLFSCTNYVVGKNLRNAGDIYTVPPAPPVQ